MPMLIILALSGVSGLLAAGSFLDDGADAADRVGPWLAVGGALAVAGGAVYVASKR